MAAPTPAPTGRVTTLGTTSFVLTMLTVSGEASTTLRLQTRALGGNAAWATAASDATPAVGDTLTASGLTADMSYEWRLIEENAGGEQADGTHGITTPSSAALWATLTSTIQTALEGQGFESADIFVGRQPEPNPDDIVAILRTLPEIAERKATNAERVIYPVEVELRYRVVDDDGSAHKSTIQSWQRLLEAQLHRKTFADFPGISQLEQIEVEIVSKDLDPRDAYDDEIRARAIVRFYVWRS